LIEADPFLPPVVVFAACQTSDLPTFEQTSGLAFVPDLDPNLEHVLTLVVAKLKVFGSPDRNSDKTITTEKRVRFPTSMILLLFTSSKFSSPEYP
jgi:hypothetical protein